MADGFEYSKKNTGVVTIQRDLKRVPLEEFSNMLAGFISDAAAAGARHVSVDVAPNGGVVFRFEGSGRERASQPQQQPSVDIPIIRPSWGGTVWDATAEPVLREAA